MLFEGIPTGGAARMSEHARTNKKAKVRPDLTWENTETVFASSGAAEKSVERAALKTRTEARPVAADHIRRPLACSALFAQSPTKLDMPGRRY
jgi:hypothetical protein